LLSALLLQSTLPYYLMHLLPLIALTVAAHFGEWRQYGWTRVVIAIGGLGLAVQVTLIAIPELENASRIGKRINDANLTAVQAAIEQESREWEHTKPLVLAQGPAVHELLRDSSVRIMTESFLFFPQAHESPDSTIAHQHVEYILDYDRPMTADYQRAIQKFTPIFSRTGPLLDRTVDYFHDSTSELDTLTLYVRPDSTIANGK
jgi:hypothetical protein